MAQVKFFEVSPARHVQSTHVFAWVNINLDSRVEALQETPFALTYFLSESLFNEGQFGKGNFHSSHNSAPFLLLLRHSRLIRQVSRQVLHLILALAQLVWVELEFDIDWLHELHL